MAIQENNGGSNTVYFEYSPTPGLLVRSNEATRELLSKARQEAGEDAWKRGYDGLTSKSVASVARRFLRENGVSIGIKLSGAIDSVYYSERAHANGLYQDVRVKLYDEDAQEGYLVTLSVSSSAGQALIRKLANDVIEPGTVISAFSVFPGTARKVGDREFFNHAVELKDEHGEEIKQAPGIFEEAVALAKAKVDLLEKRASLTRHSSTILATRRSATSTSTSSRR